MGFWCINVSLTEPIGRGEESFVGLFYCEYSKYLSETARKKRRCFVESQAKSSSCLGPTDEKTLEPEFVNLLKVHKNENFFGFDFEFCTISLLVMHK